jgi:hypothetical protein
LGRQGSIPRSRAEGLAPPVLARSRLCTPCFYQAHWWSIWFPWLRAFAAVLVYRYFFSYVHPGCFSSLRTLGVKETARILASRSVPYIPTGSLFNYLIFSQVFSSCVCTFVSCCRRSKWGEWWRQIGSSIEMVLLLCNTVIDSGGDSVRNHKFVYSST